MENKGIEPLTSWLPVDKSLFYLVVIQVVKKYRVRKIAHFAAFWHLKRALQFDYWKNIIKEVIFVNIDKLKSSLVIQILVLISSKKTFNLIIRCHMVHYIIKNACLAVSKEFYYRWDTSILQKCLCFKHPNYLILC